jgi:arylsulfatase
VTPDYADRGTFPFTGRTTDEVIVDVSGDRYIGHQAQVRAWFAID